MKRSFAEKLRRFLVPPVCPGCGEVLDPAWTADFCPTCQTLWDELTAECCPVCRRPASDCLCRPSALRELPDTPVLSLFFYAHYDAAHLGDRMLYAAKRQEDAGCLPFLAQQLSGRLRRHAMETGLELRNFCLVYPPRTRSARREYGFDQAEILCDLVAQQAGLRHASLFRRIGGGEQKLENSAGRQENARKSLVLRTPVPAAAGFVILDDVVTTGATVGQCVRLLRGQGKDPLPCIILSVARTVPLPQKVAPPAAKEALWFE